MLTALKLKGMGVRKGVADFILLRNFCPIALELKAKDGKQSEDQKGFEDAWTAQGGVYYLCKDIDDVRDIINICLLS